MHATLLLVPNFQTSVISFSNPLGTLSSKMESLRKLKKVLRVGEEGEKNMAAV